MPLTLIIIKLIIIIKLYSHENMIKHEYMQQIIKKNTKHKKINPNVLMKEKKSLTLVS